MQLLNRALVAWLVACQLQKQWSCDRSRLRHLLSWKNNFTLLMIQEEEVVSYWSKNGHLIQVYLIVMLSLGSIDTDCVISETMF